MPFTGRAQVLIAWASEPFSAPAWTDVTNWIRLDKGIHLQRGRQDNISEIQQGRATTTGDNSDGRFTVGRSSSPWYPGVKIGRRMQVNVPDETGTLHTRFDGLISELPTAWEGGPGIVSLEEIQAQDILAWLSRQPELLSWTQQEMLADSPAALYSLADQSNATQATDQAGQGAVPLQVVSQGDGTGAAAAGSGVPLTEIQTADVVTQLQQTQTFTFTTPGSFNVTFPAGTLVKCDVVCVAGGQAGTNGTAAPAGGAGGKGAEYAEEPNLVITPGGTYSGSVGAPGAPSGGTGGNTTFTGDAVTVTAHGSGSGSTNTIHFNGGTGGAAGGAKGGGGASSGGAYQAGNNGVAGGAGGGAPTGGGAGGAGDASGAGATAGSQPGGGGGGGEGSVSVPTSGASGGAGSCTITYTYIPLASSQQNSSLPTWLFTPSATLAARILAGKLPQAVTAAAGFGLEIWGAFAGFPAAAVTTVTTPGSFTFTGPPGVTAADVACIAGGQAGTNGGASLGGAGGTGGEQAEESALALTPNGTYSGSVGAPGAPSGGLGGDTTFTGDSVTVTAHGSGSGSTNTAHHSGGAGGTNGGAKGGGGGSSGGTYQAGNAGVSGGAGGTAVAGGGAGGGGDSSGPGGTPGSAPGGGGGGGEGSSTAPTQGASGAAGQAVITCQPGVSCLLTLVNPRGQDAIAVWVTSSGHLQLASTAGYGTRAPSWTTADAGQVPSGAFHVFVDVAASTGVATLYVNDVSAGTLTLPAGASYTYLTIGGAYAGWLGGWAGSAGLAAVYPAALSSARVGVHYTAGSTGFAGSSTGTMIAKIASYTGLPSFYYTAPTGTSDSSYGLELVSYYDLKGQNPLSAMQAYEQAEGGVLYVNAAGRLVFADRASRYAAGAAGSAFTLLAGQYEPDTSFKSNDQYLCTSACYSTTHIPGGYPVSNTAVKPDFGTYTQNAGTPSAPQSAPFADATGTANVYSTDDLMDAGNWAVNVFGQPVPRVPQLTVDLLTQPASEFSIASFYGQEIGSAVQLAGLPSQAPDNTGQPLSAYQVIEGINEDITLTAHTAALYTSPLAQNAAWIPGDSLLGVLGSTDTVGRSQAPSVLGAPYPVPTFGATLNRTGSAGAQDLRGLTVNTQNKLTPPLLIAQQASAQTLTTLTGQAVTFDTAVADTAGGFTTTTTYTVQAGYAGYYWCSAVVQAATGTASLGGLAVWFAAVLNGTASQWHARSLPYLSSAPYIAVRISGKIGPCIAGDTISVVCAASGTPANVPLGTADGGSMFTLIWEGYT